MSRSRLDTLVLWGLRPAAAVTVGLVALIVYFLLSGALPAWQQVGTASFFSFEGWSPASKLYGLGPMILGTLYTTAGAIALAAPLGFGAGLFLSHYAPVWLRGPARRVIELLAGTPSVVYGLWGLVVLVPLIAKAQPPGASLLAATLILAIMILPTVALTTDAAFRQVSAKPQQAAAALGLARWDRLRLAVLPRCRPLLVTGIILAVGRALGETMAVLMVAGNIVQTPDSLFAPVRTLTANIALEMAYAMGVHQSALIVSGVVLLALVTALVLLARTVGTDTRSPS